MLQQYKTIKAASIGEYKDRNSKFIAYAYPISTEAEFKAIIEKIRIEHPKSRHVCTAHRVGIENSIERSNDDGEPSGTAGLPILRQIHSFELENIGIAVVRYFGGTLLGASGLINAYKTAALMALENAEIIEKTVEAIYRLNCGYDVYHNLMNYIKQQDFNVYEQTLTDNCILIVGLKVNLREQFEENLVNFGGVNYSFEYYK